MKRFISDASRKQLAAPVALAVGLLLVVSSADTASSGKTPAVSAAAQVRLELTLKINNGAETTKDRTVNLTFNLVEVINGTSHPASVSIKEYRVREAGLNEPLTSIEAAPWQPVHPSVGTVPAPLTLELGLHNDFGQRYGDRRVLLQVNTLDGGSDVASDTITLEPVLRDYTVHAAADHTHPLIQYAASQGFTFPRTFFQPCTGGSGGGGSEDISGGFASITGAALACPPSPPPTNVPGIGPISSPGSMLAATKPTCETRFEYELFGGRQLNRFWRIKTVNASGGDVKFHGANSFLLKGHVTELPSCCPQGTHNDGKGFCLPNNPPPSPTVTIGDIVIEGPEVDDFVDAASPWKNAFYKFPLPLIMPQPNVRPGFPPHD
ncbi:MAG TPA: hypothetical protein VFA21_00490 [Pyrinomonadaceae bacterium]|nr:hypothetical protein [Pyrinomonadaceae bacterium]